MRIPSVGDTIVWRDSNGTPRRVVVKSIGPYKIYFSSPSKPGIEMYVEFSWWGHETLGWDWPRPDEDAVTQDERIEALLSQVDMLKKSLELLRRGGCPGCPDCLSEANKASKEDGV